MLGCLSRDGKKLEAQANLKCMYGGKLVVHGTSGWEIQFDKSLAAAQQATNSQGQDNLAIDSSSGVC